eukprot:tig00020510_g9932.t1
MGESCGIVASAAPAPAAAPAVNEVADAAPAPASAVNDDYEGDDHEGADHDTIEVADMFIGDLDHDNEDLATGLPLGL